MMERGRRPILGTEPTLVEILRRRASEQPDQRALTFLNDGEGQGTVWTYADLDRRALGVARLLARHSHPGDSVVLVFPPGVDYIAAFFGCLYAGVIAVPTYMARLTRSSSRLDRVIADSGAVASLTQDRVLAGLPADVRASEKPRWLSVDALPVNGASDDLPASVDPSTIAFLQYTSGSTSTPRGVMVSHGNLIANLSVIGANFGTHEGSRGVIWLPPYHDMGLIGGILQPIFAGFPVTLMPPLPFIQRPYRWLKAISDTHATISGGPNFAYDLCVERITEEQRRTLDLSTWEVAFNGAEPIREETIERFTRAFSPCGFRREAFYPCYGLAESTLLVTGARRLEGPRVTTVLEAELSRHRVVIKPDANGSGKLLVSSGSVATGHAVTIVDPATLTPLAEGEVGEICVAGPSVSVGYWNRPEVNRELFGLKIAGREESYLRTGDLGFLSEGELYVTGRSKDLIIIRGTNYYPQDIEATVSESHQALRGGRAAAFAVVQGGVEKLVIVQEVVERSTAPIEEIFSAISQSVGMEHELPVGTIALVGHHRVPKTSSGKIQRRLCREQFLDGSLAGIIATWNAPDVPSGQGSPATAAADPSAADVPTLGLDFFGRILDARYQVDSAALWEKSDSLESAQEEKLLRLAEFADIRPGSQVLDIGCGWGGFLRYAVEALGVKRAVGITPSSLEASHIESWSDPRIGVIRHGWSKATPTGSFDSLICASAIEHFVSLTDRAAGRAGSVYRRFFRQARRWMTGTGRLALQTLVSLKRADSPRAFQDVAVLARMFPHSSIPNIEELKESARGLFEVVETVSMRRDYEKTLESWLRNLHQNRDEIIGSFGPEVFERFDRYFEASLRQSSGGYVDVAMLALRPVPVDALVDDPESDAEGMTTVSAGTAIARSANEIQEWMTAALAAKLAVDPAQVDVRQPFSSFGLDSLAMVGLVGELEVWLSRPLSPTLGWDYPTIEALALHLSGETSGARGSEDKSVLAEPIAIVGMGCRFPGSATLDDYWRVMIDQVDAIREIPADRWNIEEYYDKDPDAPGKMVTRWGGFLDAVDQFDPQFFGISPREAARMDPQQRLLLEVTFEALENAGVTMERLAGSKTGVFVGIGGTDYSQVYRRFDNSIEYLDAYCGTGNALSIAANRLSYILDLHGPSLAVDTACSSALVAIHYAVQSLRNRDCDMAIAGGVNAILTPEVTIAFSKARMLSPDGRCKTFDASANGYVRGEGCGVVLFKRLSDAVRDGDEILAVLRGTAINQDGKTTGITAPNGPAQQECVRKALRQAGVDAKDLTYIEAHGTGTPLGDPIEVNALRDVVGTRSAEEPPCYLGSIKANIGHLETASGVAGLIRVVLMMQHGMIPPQRNFSKLNPHIKLDGSPLHITTEAIPWAGLSDQRRIAGVSGFGFGGTNAHLILEAYRSTDPLEDPAEEQDPVRADRPIHVVPISAQSEGALREYADRFVQLLDRSDAFDVGDLALAAATKRTPFDFRLGVLASNRTELRDRLSAFARSESTPGIVHGPVRVRTNPKIAFLFTGQGSQYAGMARELFESEPVFRRELETCAAILRPRLEVELLDVLFDPAQGDLVDTTTYTQPALFAVEYSLAQVWRSWGIEPGFLIGHSVGEIAAATFAGVMSLEEGLSLIAERARLMGALPSGGGMAVLFAAEASVREAIESLAADVSIATINGPENTVISGARAEVDRVVSYFETRGIRTQALVVSHAFHSNLLDPMLDEFEAFASRIKYRAPSIPLISNVTGKFFGEGEVPTAAYWRRHAREAVRFADGMQTLAKSRVDLFLEVGPHPSLVAMGRRCVKASPKQLWVPSLRKGSSDVECIAQGVASLFVHGVPVDAVRRDEGLRRRKVELPTYPFQRQRYWMEEDPEKRGGGMMASLVGAHPLLGARLPLAVATTVYGSSLGTRSVPSLRDHVVQGSIVLPGAAYLEAGLAAAEATFGAGTHSLQNVTFQQALFLHEGRRKSTQVVVSPEVAGSASMQFLSMAGEPGENASWATHAAGVLRRGSAGECERASASLPLDLCEKYDLKHDRTELYDKLRARGMEYGPAFQVAQMIWKRGQQTLTRLVVPEELESELAKFHLHPAILDACIQVLGAAIPEEIIAGGTGETYLPTGVAELRRLGPAQPAMWVHAVLHTDFEKEGLHLAQGDIKLLADDGTLLALFQGVTLTRIGTSKRVKEEVAVENWVHALRWEESTGETEAEETRADLAWLVFGDDAGVASALSGLLSGRAVRPIVVVPGREFARTNSGYRLRWNDPEDYRRLISEVGPARMVYLWGLRGDLATQPAERVRPSNLSLLYLVQALESVGQGAGMLLIGTRSGQSSETEAAVDPAQASIWGLGRAIANERVDLVTKLVDLDGRETNPIAAMQLLEELLATDAERQVAYRDGRRMVLRLVAQPEMIQREEQEGTRDRTAVPSSGSYRLEVGSTATLDRLAYRPTTRRAPGPGEVEIEVAATGLNFSDVLKAMGLYPGLKPGPVPIGIECSGRISAVGPEVEEFAVGDEVLGIAPFSFGSHAITSVLGIVRKPANVSHDDAAAIPIAFLTAYYALRRLADVQPGEKVLIHAAAGGVGLAAIQVCQAIGAEVFATAGSDAKRDYLRSLGVQHIYNSRTLDFADQIRIDTDSAGVDVVLNSLPGEAIPKSIESLGPYGRFLEIGKTDIYQNRAIGLYPFQNNLSYFAIDLDKMLREKPAIVRRMFVELITLFEQGVYRPLPSVVFSADETSHAFRYMAQRKNTGKVVVSQSRGAADGEAPALVRGEGAYWITGGLGALGLEIARWLGRAGASELVLFGRSAPSEDASRVLAELESQGVRTTLVRTDVGDRTQLQNAVAKLPSKLARPMGVFHAAGVLDDGILSQQSSERFEKVLRAKVDGAWNLHEITLDAPLDHFVLFSSVAAVLGSPGQGNYAAGNAFLDGLALHRRGLGLPALSINWGPWAEVGMAARLGEEKLAARGIRPLPPVAAIEVLERLLTADAAQAVVLDADWGRMLSLYPEGPPTLFAHLSAHLGERPASDGALRARVLGTPVEERVELLQGYFVEQIARVMELDAARVNPEQPMTTLGLDSLMAIELKNQIESSLGVNLPMAKFLEGPSAHQLAKMVAELVVGVAATGDAGDAPAVSTES